MGTLFVDKLDPQSGTALEIGSSGDTLTVPSGATLSIAGTINASSGTATGFGGTNTPRFFSYVSANTSIANDTYTVLPFNAESFDSDNTFNTTNHRFTPAVQGFYYLYVHAQTDSQNSHDLVMILRKNGTDLARGRVKNAERDTISLSYVLESDDNDYFDVRLYQNSGGGRNILGSSSEPFTYFTGFKLL